MSEPSGSRARTAPSQSGSGDGARLDRRHAVVTGGGRGIGAAIAHALAAAGANVTVMGRSAQHLDATVERLRSRGARAEAVTVDVTDEASIDGAFAEAEARLGATRILVNNAGQSEGIATLETTRELWDGLLTVNLTGAFLCAKRALGSMLEQGGGRIINIASTAGLKGVPRIAAYCASKHGLIGLTRSLALEFARSGITVNAVCPGYTDTAMAHRAVQRIVANSGKTADEAKRLIERSNAFGRLVRPEEVADTVVWLCGDEASGVTGQSIVIGGEVA
ncbi:MAG: SDR family oxidoreductase [Gemmatimonadetes bacterium]|nr:SDR family oxidoreductase [Gemmatimonadota bacterium]